MEVRKVIQDIVDHQNAISRLLQVLEEKVSGSVVATQTASQSASALRSGGGVTLLLVNYGGRDSFKALIGGLRGWAKGFTERTSTEVHIETRDPEELLDPVARGTIIIPTAFMVTVRMESRALSQAILSLNKSKMDYFPIVTLNSGTKNRPRMFEIQDENGNYLKNADGTSRLPVKNFLGVELYADRFPDIMYPFSQETLENLGMFIEKIKRRDAI